MLTPAACHRRLACLSLLGVVLSMCAARPATAQLMLDELPGAEGVQIDDTRGTELPMDAVVMDADGAPHRLEEFFDGEHPVVLVLAYYRCPVLCSMVHANLRKSINEIGLTLGRDYRVVTVSFDPEDTTAAAAEHRDLYHRGLRDDPGDWGWKFCTTTEANAQRIADAAGFRYRYVPSTGEYAHPSAIFIVAPDGKLHNFIENIEYKPRDLKLALVEAAEGRVGSVFDRVFLTCFHYDPTTGKYTMVWMGVMRVVGLTCVLGLGSLIGGMLWSSARRRRLEETGDASVNLPSEDGSTDSERIKS
ncbi:MAG: SCO family protein [Phycisphaerales bacterium]|nr:SCO family protein [Phycisphaerales bacterium]